VREPNKQKLTNDEVFGLYWKFKVNIPLLAEIMGKLVTPSSYIDKFCFHLVVKFQFRSKHQFPKKNKNGLRKYENERKKMIFFILSFINH